MAVAITTKQSECLCAANLFYKKYKDQIEKLFAESFGAGHPTPIQSFFSTGAEEDGYSEDYYLKMQRLSDGQGKRKFTDSSHSEEEEDDTLSYYQKLFDHHLQFLYDEPQGEEEESPRYFKFPRQISGRQEYEDSFDYSHVDLGYQGPWMSEAQRRAENYLRNHHIYELIHFLGSHLVATITDCVENPIEFLVSLLDKCLKYRCGLIAPPLLFTQKHVESLFDTMDPMLTGIIEVEQYHTGMMTLGIRYYEKFPPLNRDGFVTKKMFVYEALKQQQNHLDIMIQDFSQVPKGQFPIEPMLHIMDADEEAYSEFEGDYLKTQGKMQLLSKIDRPVKLSTNQ